MTRAQWRRQPWRWHRRWRGGGGHVSRWPRDAGALWAAGRYKWAESVTSQWRTIEVIPSDSTYVTVHGLQPSSTYIFTVLARSVSSQPAAGQFSKVVNASTKGPSAVIYHLSVVQKQISHRWRLKDVAVPAQCIQISTTKVAGPEARFFKECTVKIYPKICYVCHKFFIC